MADIAMLVAEEYERRVKLQSSSRNREDHDDQNQNQIMVMIKKSNNIFDFKWINNNSYVEIVKHKWILLLEPKTQIALAASNGFFSA
ncbi:hypothetical protein Dsin_016637 [Dipteronia sinensis]|uniref:Uncharacterized protein n=1 Tax=Dipteronia sinensis TaxID=43782 RepID=A0AAE0ADH9_9ROSI|nr:hypothetical protein Dsin_016637 [Dipteronia sinensis]